MLNVEGKNTKSFGSSTWGLTISNGAFAVSDGFMMFLASTKMMGRNGKIYGAQLKPVVLVQDLRNAEVDEVLEAGLKWLTRNK